MSKNLRVMNAGALEVLASDAVAPILLVEALFDSGPVRLHFGLGVMVSPDGREWHGCGTLGSIGVLEETAESRSAGAQFELLGIGKPIVINGVEIDILKIASAENWQQRIVRIYYGVMAGDMTWRVAPFQIRKGFMDVMEITEGGGGGLRVTLEDDYFDLERAEVVYFTPASQHLRYPGDKALDQMATLVDRQIKWAL